VQLNPPPAGLGAVSAGGVVTPDSSRVVFTGTLDLDLTNHLYSVPIHGPSSSAIRISVDLPPGRDVTSWTAVTPDGGYVLYGADSVVAGSSQVYRVPVEGPVSANLPLSSTPASGGTVEYERVSPDGRTVFFWGDFATPGVEELFAVPFDGPADAVQRVNAPLVAGGNVYTEISWTPDGRSLAYRADQEVDGKVELYLAAVPLFVDGFESGDSGRWSSTTP
jgi:Tol biopolymer transport system component